MTDLFDRAQQQEQEFRERAIAQARRHQQEQPDQDEHGNRFCLNCGEQIASERLQAEPAAVRCVPCQSRNEKAGRHRYGI
ncbi:TraR/DksA C4-type zinc finger protein [Aeromonas allosaccharophila]|uniref:TraR/DksA C4-type zinc finger protein n=1 Tax=Aeromonas allosaccharophila TaxID=656 RepID=UPI00300473C9